LSQITDQSRKRLIASLAIGEDAWDYRGCTSLLNQFLSRQKKRTNNLLQQIKEAEDRNDFQTLTRLLKEKQQQAASNKILPKESAGG